MRITDVLAKISDKIYDVSKKKYEEEDRIIAAIYVAVEKAKIDLRNYNEATEVLINKNPLSGKVMRADKLKNKISVISQLKKDINNILREF